jgi:hypothetical protein
MNTTKEIGAYLGLALLVACVACAGILAAAVTGGVRARPAAAAAAAATFQILRRVTGRAVAAAVDSI